MVKPILNLVKNEETKTARINLYGVIGWAWDKTEEEQITAENFIKLFASLEKDYQVIDVHIHSPGGSVHEGLAICNAIKASKREVNTYNDGIAMSMGATILACGKNRYAAKGSITMIHNASTIAWGNAKSLRKTADTLDVYDDTLIEFFTDATGIAYDKFKADYFDHEDHFLTARQAEALGLVSMIETEAEAVPENLAKMNFNQVAAIYGVPGKQSPSNNANTENENMFNKFKSLSALAKVAVADVTDEMMEAVNAEIVDQKIEGVTLVLDTALQTVQDEADKVPGLEAKLTAETQKVTDLEKEVKELKAKLKLPADDAETPTPAGSDATPADGASDESFETSVDREFTNAFKHK